MEIIFAHSKLNKFFSSLEPTVRAELKKMMELLAIHGSNLREPDSKSLGNGLFELRIIDQVHVRVIYIFWRDNAVLLHGFVKKTVKMPVKDLRYAKQMKKRFLDICE